MSHATTTEEVLGKKLSEERDYWIARWDLVDGDFPPLAADFERGSAATRRPASKPLPLDDEIRRSLEKLTGQGAFLTCTTLTAALRICLYRYSGKAVQVIGSPAQRQEDALEQEQPRNALPIVDRIAEEASFKEILLRVRQTLLEAYQHQRYPCRRLLEDLGLERQEERFPLFDVALVLEGFHGPLPDLGNDLTLRFSHRSRRLEGSIEFDRSLFEEKTVQRFGEHLTHLLRAALQDVDLPAFAIPMLTPAEKAQLESFNEAAHAKPQQETVVGLFAQQASERSHSPAVVSAGATLSYGELNARANRLARQLRQRGAGPETAVGICLERSLSMAIGLIGIIKSGSAYLPLDPSHPAQRLAFVLQDASCPLVVTLKQHQERLSEGTPRLLLDEEQGAGPERDPLAPPSGSLAYVIYTSGSTGRPKGVLISHCGLLHSTHARSLYYSRRVERFLLVSPYIFDSSVAGIFGTLCQGGCLVLPPAGLERDPRGLLEAAARHSITHILCLPALYAILLKESGAGQLSSLQTVMVAGEACPRSVIDLHEQRLPEAELFNEYGPSEGTVWSSVHRLRRQDGGTVPIGSPVPYSRLFVLGPALARMPVAVAGELCIAGPALARGYLNRPARTALAFVPDPFSPHPGGRLYRTGDLVRHRRDGALEFLGRIDRQVKIRGHRVEVEEVEGLLTRHPAVSQAALAAHQFSESDTRLVAFVVAGPQAGETASRKPGESGSGSLQDEYISQTRAVYDKIYKQDSSPAGHINRRAWISSYDGQPLSQEEILETVDDLCRRILALRPRRVLEIGTGTGLVLFRVAPHCQAYLGTDISETSIDYLRRQAEAQQPPLPQVRLEQRAAHQLDGLPAGSFDAVVLSFVTQHFPSADYLIEFLEKAVQLVAPGGFIFLAGMRSLPLLETFHSAVQLHQAKGSLSAQQLRQRIRERLSSERELAIDPALFGAFQQTCPRVSHVQIQPRGGRNSNEITRFQYDALLHVESPLPVRQVSWSSWRKADMTVSALGRMLTEERPQAAGWRQVPNARLARELQAVELLHAEQCPATVEEIRRALPRQFSQSAADPADLMDLGRELGYQVEISWASGAIDGSFDLALVRRQDGKSKPVLVEPRAKSEPRPWSEYTNNPLQGLHAGQLSPRLREHLRSALPEHCLPSAFLYLEALPVTASGKLDRRALQKMARTPMGSSGAQAAPRTATQKELAEIWCDVLGIARAGLNDDFFDLGGHSLLATQALSAIRRSFGVELDLEALFQASSLEAMARLIDRFRQVRPGQPAPIQRVGRDQELPLSFAQQRLWFLAQLEPESALYHIPSLLRLKGDLKVGALEASLNQIVRRHEALRTVFPASQGKPVQQIRPASGLPLPVVDLGELTPGLGRSELARLGEELVHLPFDLGTGPLLRVLLLRLARGEHALAVVMHHIISDGWSMGILVQELTELYRASSAGRAARLPELPLQYADFAHWQRSWLSGDVLEEQREYWRNRLQGAPPLLKLTTDRPRPNLRSHRGTTELFVLPGKLSQEWSDLTRRRDSTLFMSLLAAFQLLLARYSGQDDVSVGTLIANRNRPETEGLIGFFVNTLVMRCRFSGQTGFLELLDQVRQDSLQAFAHQDVPFEQVVEDLQPERSLSHAPLFQVMFVLQNVPMASLQLADLEASLVSPEAVLAEFDLSLLAAEGPEGIEGMIEYSQDLFEASTIRRLIRHLQTLLEEIVASPRRSVFELPLLGKPERHQMLLDFNDTRAAYSSRLCVHQLFEMQAGRTPEAAALEWDGRQMTYRELDERANQLAHLLRSRGAKPEDLVGLCLEPGPDTLTAMLGILKAGAGYLPLDPGFPPDRLAFMMEDAEISLLVTHEALLIGLPGSAQPVCLDADQMQIDQQPASRPPAFAAAHNLVYVIYTSGSTGKPKGVVIRHHPLVNYVEHIAAEYRLGEGDRVLQYGSVSFDVAAEEIYPCLARGGTLVLRSEEMLTSTAAFLDICRQSQLAVLNIPTAYWHQLAVDLRAEDLELPPDLRLIVIGGERALPSHLQMWRQQVKGRVRLINAYGPTESTIGASLCRLAGGRRQEAGGRKKGSGSSQLGARNLGPGTRDPSSQGEVPVGRPNRNTRIYLLDRALQPVPIGVIAELFIAGVGVAQGYLKRPGLTAVSFLPDPFSRRPGERFYRSGDLARWRPDGLLEFQGRSDHQVKLRGFRIEIGEIESALSRHPAVTEAAVAVREDIPGQKRLVAYLASDADRPPPSAALQAFLRQDLPEYMVPPLYVVLKELPLTSGGKLDRKALPEDAVSESGRPCTAPSTVSEEVLAGIWADVLHIDRVGAEDNFFDLGGHSLLATQMISRIHQAFEVELPLWELFEARTLADLARRIDQLRQGPGSSPTAIEPVSREEELPLSFAQQRMWFMDQLMPGSSINNIPMSARLHGQLEVSALQAALTEILRRHEVLRTSYPIVQGKPRQLIHDPAGWPLGVVDLSGLQDGEEIAEALTRQEARRGFDLAEGPLCRASLLRLGPGEHVLLVTLHHIVSDGWSTGVFTRELTELYQAGRSGEPSPLPELPIQFADFAHWQRQWMSGEVLKEQIDYWESALAPPPPVLKLPIDRPRPERETYRGGTESFLVSTEILQAFRQLARQEDATLYMALLAAYQTFLSRLSGQQDILAGSPITNRNRPETEPLIGFFSNTLVMRSDLSGNPSFRQLLRRVRQVALGAYAHQDLPLERLVEALQPERSLSHSPLFQVLFTFQNAQDHLLELPGLTLSLGSQADIGAAKCDLTLIMTEAIRLGGLWVYNSDLFKAATIKRLSDQFQTLLSSIVDQPDALIEELDMMTESERRSFAMQRKERQKSKFDKLLSLQSKGVSLKKKEVIRTRLLKAEERLPAVIEPALGDVDLSDWASHQLDFIEGKLFDHGAILFRGFNIDSVAEFERFVQTVCPELRTDYGDLPPEQGSKTIYRSTPYPNDKMILFHNESSHLDTWPLKQFFCCLKVAPKGGETPLADCRKIYRLLSQETRKRFADKKLMYVRNFTSGLDVSWQDFFRSQDPQEAERQCRQGGMSWQWRDDGGLQTRKVCAAVARHPRTGETVFFNQIELHHPYFLDPQDRQALQGIFDEDHFPRNVFYGDGTPIEEEALAEVKQAFEQASVANPWRPGDLIMLDNMLTAHARNPFEGERKVVVAMGQVTAEADLEPVGEPA